MNTDGPLAALTERILKCAYEVLNSLGHGFSEKVYENSMVIELRDEGLTVEQQVSYEVTYKGQKVGHYVADIVVEGQVLVELKAVKGLDEAHVGQCLNYLKASGLKVCLLLNFARPKLEIRRIVH